MIIQKVTFRTPLSEAQVRAVADSRADQFRALPGLVQKYYYHDREAGTFGGVYVWDSAESMAAYRTSELARSIPAAYQVTEPPKVEILEVLMPLRT